jgi:serine/threonine protein kinase
MLAFSRLWCKILGTLTMAPDEPQSSEIGDLPEIGTTLGDYRLEGVLSDGGMGRIYKARHSRLGRQVALKMLLPKLLKDESLTRRFFGEARAVNRIRHENLIEVTDFSADGGANAYYIMELLEGRSLRDLLVSVTGPLPLERSMHIWLQLADVLAALHEDNIVHRDLKPENIFLVTRGGTQDYVKLIDFGVARILDAEGAQILPAEGANTILGTPHYMSPEQSDAGDVDDLTDVFAFGVMMYEMATGRLPHDAPTFADLFVLKRTVIPLRPADVSDLPFAIPVELSDLIMECLSIKPADRPQSMQEVRLRLMMLESLEVNARPEPAPPSTMAPEDSAGVGRRRRARQLRLAVYGGVIFLAGAMVLGLVSVLRPNRDDPADTVSLGERVIAAPATVDIKLSSSPGKAEVFRGADTVPMGTTPFVWPLSPHGPEEIVTFRLAGFNDSQRHVNPATDREVHVVLTKRSDVPADDRVRKRKKSRLKPGGFIDPFNKK